MTNHAKIFPALTTSVAWGGRLAMTLAMTLIMTVAMLVLAAFTSVHTADPPHSDLTVSPRFQRLDLAGGAITTVGLTLTAGVPTTIIAAESDCRCVALTTPLPLQVIPGQVQNLEVRVAGVSTGIERLTLRTTAGPVVCDIQIVTDGLGQGRNGIPMYQRSDLSVLYYLVGVAGCAS